MNKEDLYNIQNGDTGRQMAEGLKSNFEGIIEDISLKKEKVKVENVAVATKELQPNIYYVFGGVAELTITLAAGEEGELSEYMFEFTSGTTATTLNLPETIKYIGSNTIEASKTYQVSIVNNIAVLGGA